MYSEGPDLFTVPVEGLCVHPRVVIEIAFKLPVYNCSLKYVDYKI